MVKFSFGEGVETEMATYLSAATFMYFAYGSNLLRERIQIKNPTARFHGLGKLQVSDLFTVLI